MENAKYTSYQTNALFDPSTGAGSVFAGDNNIPRSLASDGRRWVLFLHVLVHIGALACNVFNTVFMNRDFEQTQIKTVSIVATVMHGIGVLSLLALAASEMKQITFVVSMSLILSFLLSALLATAVVSTFTFRSDDMLTTSHTVYYASTYLQTLGLSFIAACAFNMAANGDVAIDKKPVVVTDVATA